jgi:hypothetical protein
MKIKPENYCPLIKKDCIGLKCSWYTQVRGVNPNTGEEVDEWGCAITWLPMMIIENSQQQRSTSSAVESFRNEMVDANKSNINVLSVAAQMLQASIDEKNNIILPTEVKEVKDE